MFKSLLKQIIIYIQITICYLVLGATILKFNDIRVPLSILILLTWIIPPVISAMLAFISTKYLSIKRAKPYIILSFIWNLLCVLIYTWIESRQPHIEGDFMDFRGLIFVVYGIGQIVGIIFTTLFKEKNALKKSLF